MLTPTIPPSKILAHTKTIDEIIYSFTMKDVMGVSRDYVFISSGYSFSNFSHNFVKAYFAMV